MQLLVISGFLGSGKTSILMPLVKKLTKQGKKIAIIENEVGKAGVDDIFLKENGLNVKEIFSGCICCSLRMDLVQALLEVEREYSPDLVILEPSGVAGPRQVLSALNGYGGEIDSKTLLSIVDAERFAKLADMSIPIITDGIQKADLVVVNKIDLVSKEETLSLRNKLLDLNKDADIIDISILENKNVEEFYSKVETILESSKTKPVETIIEEKAKIGEAPKIYSTEFTYSAEEICLSEKEIKIHFADKIYKIAKELAKAKASVIGNLKLIIKSDKGGYILISTTSFERLPEITGRLPKNYSKITFNLNAMIYGIEKIELEKIINKTIKNWELRINN